MDCNKEMLSFLDLLDLDEEMVDTRLHSLMMRSNHTNRHLAHALQLLHYKHLINIKENGHCDNVQEFDFVAKLVKEINEDIIENVCKITNIVLKLNPDTLHCSCEHLLMQIVHNIELSCDHFASSDASEKDKSTTLLYFKVCDSILDTVIEEGDKLSMVFMNIPIKKILSCLDIQAKVHFLTSTVPKLFEGVEKYDILTEIWDYLKDIQYDGKVEALRILSSLSSYYLPVAANKQNAKFESTLVFFYNFWDIILYGLMSIDPSLRKISVYLAKRAIDYINFLSMSLHIESSGHTIFSWDYRKNDVYKTNWDNFFILIDSLEEKQSNIVLPSLQLFDNLSVIEHCWLIAAYNIGLKHDNNQVRLKCAEHRMKTDINSDSEAVILLQALDDIHFYENSNESVNLKTQFSGLVKNKLNMILILKAIPEAHLSPVPFYHLSEVLAGLDNGINLIHVANLADIITSILKTSCNIIAIRKAVHINIAKFVGNYCKNIHWKDIAQIISSLQLEIKTLEETKNPILKLIHDLKLGEEEKKILYNYMTGSHLSIDIGLVYILSHYEDFNAYMEIVNEKVLSIQNVTRRQYSNKMDCFKDVLYILTLLNKCDNKDTVIVEAVKLLANEANTISQYICCLLSIDSCLNMNEIKTLFDNNIWQNDEWNDNILIDIYKTSAILLRDPGTDLDKIVLCMFIINSLEHNLFIRKNFKHEMLELKSLLQIEEQLEKRAIAKAGSVGRTRNMFYEKHCETILTKLEEVDIKIDSHVQIIVNYVEKVMECGGYGCLKWVLKIMNNIVKNITNCDKTNLNITQFINRAWTEIEELKTNNQYPLCMKEFVNLITEESLVHNPEYNNIITVYCTKIIEYGSVKNSPLYYLIERLHNLILDRKADGKHIKEYGHIIFILSEILLYCPVPRKDQRIADNLALEILKNLMIGVLKTDIDLHFNYEIQFTAVSILSTIDDNETLQVITSIITNKINNIFKTKLRYHGNSQMHRTFQTGLQHLLFMLLLSPNIAIEKVFEWSMELLGRLPHQLSVRICLEWYIALYFYNKKVDLSTHLLQILQSKNLSLPSQFTIIYWLLKHKIANGSNTKEEYEFVMDTLLSHTMGQMFNIRLLAQFLATKLYKLYTDNNKYQYIIEVTDRTLEDNCKDKNYLKLKEDYFFNEFDLVGNLTPYFIYYLLPRLCDVNLNETVDTNFVFNSMKEINANVEKRGFNEWAKNRKRDEELVKIEINRLLDNKARDEVELLGTIQKKYIPWKNMSDINVYDAEKKRETSSGLIVVASLIDKLPNLGGMARTGEVFGVKTYVIDSLRHLQDKQFQGLSVSAERWIDVEEVRPGDPLKDYINRKKAEGYSVVAAEQTSTSAKLQTFKFPKKTLLLLGHEKEGIPCDLLPMMDHCVEIPQQGFVRSLNVHVTAAIFVWEYTRQNIL